MGRLWLDFQPMCNISMQELSFAHDRRFSEMADAVQKQAINSRKA